MIYDDYIPNLKQCSTYARPDVVLQVYLPEGERGRPGVQSVYNVAHLPYIGATKEKKR